jgi:hypothetical protein
MWYIILLLLFSLGAGTCFIVNYSGQMTKSLVVVASNGDILQHPQQVMTISMQLC